MAQLGHKSTDLERYIFLMNLFDNDQTLFYRTIMSDPARFLPIIYAPTIGEACLNYSHIFRGPRAMYISINRRGHVKEILRNWPVKDVRFICVTNGGRILGFGDIGANGTPIPIGKLQLYTAVAGVPPQYLLPMYIDAGTNNETYLSDPLYLGIRQTRPSTEDLYSFVDEFVEAVQEVFPLCCIHFEDWTGVDAIRLLDRYRDKVSCFNDDIQGTGGTAVTGLVNAMRITGGKFSDQRILFFGAGSAAIGIANMIATTIALDGVTIDEARSKIWLFNRKGIVESSRSDLEDYQLPYAHEHAPIKDLVEAIKILKPTAIIGVSAVPKAFTKEVVEAMSAVNTRPIIFALSNPTDHAECSAQEAYTWSKGKALFAAGVQFPPFEYEGKVLLPGQGNNSYIFPAVGMAVFATQAKRVIDEMFVVAARSVAHLVSPEQLEQGLLYPVQSNILETEIRTAIQVAQLIFDKGLARVERPSDLESFIRGHVFKPEYPELV